MRPAYLFFIVILFIISCTTIQHKNETNETDAITIGWITYFSRISVQSDDNSKNKKIKLGNFRPVAEIAGSRISKTTGETIKNGQAYWPVLDTAHPVELSNVNAARDRLGKDHWVYHGTIDDNGLKSFTLLSSKPVNEFHEPSSDEISLFNELDTECEQGTRNDSNYSPPCTKGMLLAVSDIDKNGNPEYWATESYTWDTGLTVYEIEDNTLEPLLRVCVGCSD